MESLTKLCPSDFDDGLECPSLRLRAGASPFPCWKFREHDQGLQILIGSDPSCDWRILSAGVREQELQVFFSGRTLLARSMRPGLGARVDGVRLDSGWFPLQNGARVEIGLACIEAKLPLQKVDSDPERRAANFAQAPLFAAPTVVRDHTARVDDWERARQQAEQAAQAAGEADAEARRWTRDGGAAQRSANDIPREPRIESLSPQPELIRYALYVVMLGLVYAAWVLVTDRFGG